MSCRSGVVVLALTALALMIAAQAAIAVAPTKQALEKWKAEGVLEEKLASLQAFKAAGGCSPSVHPVWDKNRYAAKLALNAKAVDTQNVLVLLVDFQDTTFSQPPAKIHEAFDSILFSDKEKGGIINPTGSMTDYYKEVSYGAIYIRGFVYGPYTASNTYSYYISTDNGFNHSPGLVREALTLADGDINYNQFAISGMVPSVIVIHCGVGAEGGGDGIWSHKSSVGGLTLDGVHFQDYTMNPEMIDQMTLSPIGVFCHEYGHVLGLPDLYDTQYHNGSSGLGDWSLMASGNYNGLYTGRSPAHFDAWSKIFLGFIPLDSVQIIGQNLANVQIPAIEYTPKVYEIPDSVYVIDSITYTSSEYFLVENRQFMGSDVGLPGSGLLIYHIDRGVPVGTWNNDPTRYAVGVVQADGANQLATPPGNRGDAGDPWPGAASARNFNNLTTPNSRLNVGGTVTEVGLWDISNSDSVMTANLDYTYSRPYLVLSGADSLQFLDTMAGDNNDSIIDAGEPVTFTCKVRNYMRQAYNWSVTLACDNPDVQFLSNNVAQGANNLLNPAQGAKKADVPVVLQLAPGGKGSFATFTVTITADSGFHSGDRLFSSSFQFKKIIGSPELLLVDDDNGGTYENKFVDIFQRIGLPYRIWHKTSGSPTAGDLIALKNVFWMGGAVPTGTLTTADVAAMKGLLDAGGNLCLATSTVAAQLTALDTSFLYNYLHAQQLDSSIATYFFGTPGNPVMDQAKFKFTTSVPFGNLKLHYLAALNGGQVALSSSTHSNGVPLVGGCGVTYNSGTYKTVIQSVPIEFISLADTTSGFLTPDSMVQRILGFFNGSATGVDDNGQNNLPASFALGQNYPNPFNPTTTIAYSIPAVSGGGSTRARTQLLIYNLLGQKVKMLVDADQGPGNYSVSWDGSTDAGTKVASGIYLYRLTRGDLKAVRKMVMLK